MTWSPLLYCFPFLSCFIVVCFLSFSFLIHLSKTDGNAGSLPDGNKQENSLQFLPLIADLHREMFAHLILSEDFLFLVKYTIQGRKVL